MSLLDRIRPKWQHSDPEERAAAVRELGRSDLEALSTVVREDDDPRVRRLAIKKLEDPDVLFEVSRRDADASLRELANERAASLLAHVAVSGAAVEVCEGALARLDDPQLLASVALDATHPSIRRLALSRVDDEKALGEIARTTRDVGIGREALGRIHDVAVLRRIAVAEGLSELAAEALENIYDPETLDGIAEDRAANKRVRQRAKAKLDRLIGDDHPIRHRERRQRQAELCQAVEALVGSPDLPEAAEQTRGARSEWEALALLTQPAEQLQQRFAEACEHIMTEVARQERLQADADRLQANLSAAQTLCAQVEAIDGDAAPQELRSAQAAWRRLAPLPEECADALAARFAQACRACGDRYERWQRRAAFRSKVAALVEEAEELARSDELLEALEGWEALERRWTGVTSSARDWPEAEEALRARFVRAGDRLQARCKAAEQRLEKQKQQNLAELEALCTRLETLAKADALNLRDADRELHAVRELGRIKPLPASASRKAWAARIEAARQELYRRFQSQKDADQWKRWANADAQEKLIGELETLLATNDLRKAVKDLRRIQEDWKRFGAAPRGQSEVLWARFRTARDELRCRCDAYLESNVTRKEALCEQVQALAESTDWIKTADEIKRLQAAWKEIGPVPQKISQALWERFRQPCDQFFERRNQHFAERKEERDRNAAKKLELCTRVEALADSTDWDNTAQEIKALQAEWKQIGPVGRKQSDALWNRFRTACDHFFDRRKRRGEIEREQCLVQAAAVCDTLESLAAACEGPDVSPADIGEQVKVCVTEWGALGGVHGKDAEALLARFRAACERIAAAQPDSLRGTALDPVTTGKRREKLCIRLEELVAAATQPPKEESLQDLAAKLKQAWAANTIGGSAEPKRDWRAAVRDVERLKASWDRLGPVIGEAAQRFADRFETAYATFFDHRPAPAPGERRDTTT